METISCDILIIGGGPSGLTAGLYASRSRMKTVLVERMGCGGQAVITDWIENYPGFVDGISGFELATKFEEQARKFGLDVQLAEVSTLERRSDGTFVAQTAEKTFEAAAVIISSGAHHKHMNVPGESELTGRGVSYCATCDGPFFRDKKVVVVGGGNSAVQEAIYLTKFASSVTLVHRRDALRAAKVLEDRARQNPRITFAWNSVVTSVNGTEKVESVTLRNVKDNTLSELPSDGVFVFVGLVPNTDWCPSWVPRDEAGYIITDDCMQTSTPGLFACGDVRHTLLRQVVTAAGDGATAAFAAEEYVTNRTTGK